MITKAALLSCCGEYRYWLTRTLPDGENKGTCVFVMLNPSKADADIDDPTIRRCMDFTWRWGFHKLHVVNLFAYRATSPKDMKAASEPHGPMNEQHFKEAVSGADLVVCAWGKDGKHLGQSDVALRWIEECGVKPHALKMTKDGQPYHPLYLPKITKPLPINSREAEG